LLVGKFCEYRRFGPLPEDVCARLAGIEDKGDATLGQPLANEPAITAAKIDVHDRGRQIRQTDYP